MAPLFTVNFPKIPAALRTGRQHPGGTPAFQPSYGGQYIINYNAVTAAGDEYPSNNSSSTTLTIGSSFGYAPLDAGTGLPVSQAGVMPSPRNGAFSYCLHFRRPTRAALP